jgi:hypothetical protein
MAVIAERKQREKEIEEARVEEEKALRDEMEQMKLSGPVSCTRALCYWTYRLVDDWWSCCSAFNRWS